MKKTFNQQYRKLLGHPVLVKWIDSGFEKSGWKEIADEIEMTEKAKGEVLSMGLLLHEGKDFISLVQTVDLENDNCSNIFGILKKNIEAICLAAPAAKTGEAQDALHIAREMIFKAHQK